MPGGNWYGVDNIGYYPSATPTTGSGGSARGPIKAPHPPAHPPGPHRPTLIATNAKPVAASGISPVSRTFVFQKDSAGMGVPRGTLGRLGGFSHQTETRGIAQTQIYASVPQAGHAYGGSTSTNVLAGSIHRGSPPPPSYSSGSMSSWSGGNMGSGSSGGSSSGASVSSGVSHGSAPISTPVASAPVAVHR